MPAARALLDRLNAGLPVDAAVAQDAAAGLAAWEKIYSVVSHPRCANCHVADGRPMWSGPSYGEARVHGMNVGGDPNLLFGNPGLFCNTCHMAENSEKPHGPPGAEVWHLPPPEMVWWKRTSAEICAQLQDPERNGGRTLADVETHVAEDALVAWGWAPGPGREPAPYSAEETAQFIADWAQNGAPCPAGNG
ncbi:MAG: hypothetical protein AAGJ87_07540 [Pseudomonadota bacterium]